TRETTIMPRSMSPCFLIPPLASLVLAAASGCGQGAPPVSSSRTEAVVRGKVVIRGQTPGGGDIVFDPANYRPRDVGARRCPLGKDGTYTITTLLGENSVRYEGPAIAGNRELEGTSVTYDVKEGENQFDLVLPPK